MTAPRRVVYWCAVCRAEVAARSVHREQPQPHVTVYWHRAPLGVAHVVRREVHPYLWPLDARGEVARQRGAA